MISYKYDDQAESKFYQELVEVAIKALDEVCEVGIQTT